MPPVAIVPSRSPSAIASLIGLGLGLGLGLARPSLPAPPPAPAPPVIVPAPYPAPVVIAAPVVVPAPPPLSARERATACPPITAPADDRRIGARLAAGARASDPLDGAPVLGVAVSPSAPGVIAAWTAGGAWTSADDGATWREVLSDEDDVAGMAVDCHGDVWVLRGYRHVGVVQRDGRERWTSAPLESPGYLDDADAFRREDFRAPPAIASGGGVVAVLATGAIERSLAVSDDRGASWVVHDLFTDSESAGQFLAIDHEGRWRATTTWFDCMLGGQHVLSGEAMRPRKHAVPGIESGAFPAADGWLYAAGGEYGPCRASLCALAPGAKRWRAVADGRGDDANRVAGVHGAGTTIIAVDDELYTATAGAVRRYGVTLPSGATLAAVDAGGRIYALEHTGLLRWSERHGWRRILGGS